MLKPEEIFGDRYKLKRVLGESANCQTWLGEDLRNNEQVAIKFLVASDNLEWEKLRLFEREAKVLQQLDHLYIPEYRNNFVVGQPVKYFALVQEYIPAKSLKDELTAGKIFNEVEAREIAIAVLEILTYLHTLSPPVLHRDIKPSNLLIRYPQSSSKHQKIQIYLIDFGAVQDKAAKEGATFTIVGTYGYAPLEQFGGRATPASDLYALGATLVHLVTGTPPADLSQFDGKMQFAHLVNMNPGFVRWLQKMTEPNLENRFANAFQALEALKINQLAIANRTQNIPHPDIFVNKSADKLVIRIPGKKNIGALVMSGIGLGFLFLIWLPILRMEAPLYPQILWIITCLLLGCFAVSWWVLPSFVNSYIYFEHHNFKIKWKLFGLTLKTQTGSVLDISKVYSSNAGMSGMKKIYEVVLSLGVQEYFFGRPRSSLTQEESRYIAAEIREWLGME